MTRLFFCLLLALLWSEQATANDTRKTEVLNYIEKNLKRDDGSFGWEDQYDGHLTPSFAVVGILHNLESLPADKDALTHFIRTRHPQTGTNKEAGPSGSELRNLVFQQIQSLVWLNQDVTEFQTLVDGWKSQAGNLYNYEKGGNPVFMQEMMTPVCRNLIGLPVASTDMLAYMNERRRSNGSFNNTPANDGSDGNMINTYWGIEALKIYDKLDELKPRTIQWIQSCALKNGGFTHQPNPALGGNDDVVYTWAALKSLAILGAKPQNKQAVLDYLLSLQNPDGGFGNQLGLPSTPMATFYAIDALKSMGAIKELNKTRKIEPSVAEKSVEEFSNYKIFTIQFEAHGSGSPEEAVMLADKLKIHLWGAKNPNPEWVEAAQKIADEKKVDVTFFYSNEAYDKRIQIEGMGNFNHVLDHIFPRTSSFSPPAGDSDSWKYFDNGFIDPLMKDNGAMIFQVSNNEPMTKILLDESLKKGSYAGISTIHFSQNFLFFLPHLNQYRYRIPFVALQDAHGPEAWWWMHELMGYRTLFLAKEPTYEAMMKALKNNWIVAVRHDNVSNYKTRILGGAEGVQKFVMANMDEWKWWDEKNIPMNRPDVAITVVGSNDNLEVGIPESGFNIRIRCRWVSNRQFLKEPAVVLEKLFVDGQEVKPEHVQQVNQRGQILDSYFLYSVKDPIEKNYEIKAVTRDKETNIFKTVVENYIYKHEPVKLTN